MHAVRIGEARLPYFFAGKHQHGRGVADEGVEQRVQHRAVRHALWIGRGIAIEAIFADIEEKGRQVFIRKIGQQPDIAIKVEVIDRRLQLRVHVRQQMKHITLQLWHVGDGNLLGIGKSIERAEQIAEGVAQFAILVGHASEDFLANAMVLGEVDGQRP